ncbi:MAG: hypothetical protein AMXMBFR82_25610 [Candidatus Hydrogenedentota bacterium]
MRRIACGIGILVIQLAGVGHWTVAAGLPLANGEDGASAAFTPAIETVVVEIALNHAERSLAADESQMAAYWEQWGEEAVPVVRDLYEDPQWSDHRYGAALLLVTSPFPRAMTYLQCRVRWLARKEKQGEKDFGELGMLCNMLAVNRPDAASSVLEELAGSEDWRPRSALARAMVLMNAEDDLTALSEILKRLPAKDLRRLIRSVDYWESQSRALEPMERVISGQPGLSPFFGKAGRAGQNVDLAATTRRDIAASRPNEWTDAFSEGRINLEKLRLPTTASRSELVRILIDRVDGIDRVHVKNRDEVTQYATIARALNDKDTVRPFENLLLRTREDTELSGMYGGWSWAAIATIASLAGDDCIKFLANLAQNPNVDPKVRAHAIMGLGHLGTRESVDAFVRLRNAALKKAGAPARKESYTHAEKMAEATRMTLFVIPDSEDAVLAISIDGARVDSNYETGEIAVEISGATTLRLRRFGDEWLVVDIVASWIH